VSLKANFNIFYEFITPSLFADLRFVSIYLWQNKRIGEMLKIYFIYKVAGKKSRRAI
jgi:hypothetical protein